MIRRLLSIAIIGYLCFFILSPLFGLHVHHACLEGAHGFETHNKHIDHDHHHGNECQAESIYEHTFEQGAASDNPTDDFFSCIALVAPLPIFISFPHVVFLPFTLENLEDKFDFEPDIGDLFYFSESISLRAPPENLSYPPLIQFSFLGDFL